VAGPGNILIRVGAETSAAQRELRGLAGPLDDVSTKGQKMGSAVRGATLPAIAVLGGLAVAAKGAAQAAAEDEAAQVKLAGALERTTGATGAQIAAAESWITKQALATGVADDQLRPALAKLAAATGSVASGQNALGLAMDISAQSGKSLDVVSKALAGAYDGKTAALAKLVPGLDQATLKSKDMTAITGELSRMVGGAATEAANTATGKYNRMQVQLGELQETIGAGLVPIVSRLTSVVMAATSAAANHTTAAKVVIGVVAALAAGVLVARAAMAVYTAAQVAARGAAAAWAAAQWLVNAALTANPIGLVVVAIAALTAGIIIAYKRSETFRDAVNGAWAILRNSPVGIVVGHFQSLASAVQSVVSWISRISFPSPPSWFGKIGGILGAPAPPIGGRALSAARGPRGAGVAGPRGAGPRRSGPLAGMLSASQGVTIIVNGATDPEGTARAIRRTLKGHARRQGAFGRIAAAGA
jgi:hypothetical protein